VRVLGRPLVCLVVASLVAAGCRSTTGAPKAGRLSQAIVDPAVAIQESLAKDSLAGVPDNAGRIEREAASLQPPAPAIASAAGQLKRTSSLDSARVAFGGLSEALVAYIDGNKLKLDPRIHVAFCPMVLKPWLQAGTVVANPYYGSRMPNCGSIK
jgi:hypothetical protein